MIYFTADTHFNHELILKNRRLGSVEDMNELLISRWNEHINPGDRVYHLGDFAFGSMTEWKSIRARLDGKIHLILGNHDFYHRDPKKIKGYNLFESVEKRLVKSFYGVRFVLTHGPEDLPPGRIINLHGHTHRALPTGFWNPRTFDVGVDGNGYKPWSVEQIIQYLEERKVI